MKRKMIQLLIILATVGIAARANSQDQSSGTQDASGQGGRNAAQFQSSAVRILGPVLGRRSQTTLS